MTIPRNVFRTRITLKKAKDGNFDRPQAKRDLIRQILAPSLNPEKFKAKAQKLEYEHTDKLNLLKLEYFGIITKIKRFTLYSHNSVRPQQDVFEDLTRILKNVPTSNRFSKLHNRPVQGLTTH